MCGKNTFPVEPAMYKLRTIELALLKGMEINDHPLKAGAYAELGPAMIRRSKIKVGRVEWNLKKFSIIYSLFPIYTLICSLIKKRLRRI
ncbi:MAG: hypothetical protein ACFE9R_11525 [Candidatus Hermodarchaeota archaeon]